MKKTKITNTMKKHYSVDDLINYLEKKRKRPLSKEMIIAVKNLIEEKRKDNLQFAEDLIKSGLFQLAIIIRGNQVSVKDFFNLFSNFLHNKDTNWIDLRQFLRLKSLFKYKTAEEIYQSKSIEALGDNFALLNLTMLQVLETATQMRLLDKLRDYCLGVVQNAKKI